MNESLINPFAHRLPQIDSIKRGTGFKFQKQPRCSYKKEFWKYAANLHDKTDAEVWFQ